MVEEQAQRETAAADVGALVVNVVMATIKLPRIGSMEWLELVEKWGYEDWQRRPGNSGDLSEDEKWARLQHRRTVSTAIKRHEAEAIVLERNYEVLELRDRLLREAKAALSAEEQAHKCTLVHLPVLIQLMCAFTMVHGRKPDSVTVAPVNGPVVDVVFSGELVRYFIRSATRATVLHDPGSQNETCWSFSATPGSHGLPEQPLWPAPRQLDSMLARLNRPADAIEPLGDSDEVLDMLVSLPLADVLALVHHPCDDRDHCEFHRPDGLLERLLIVVREAVAGARKPS